MRLLDKIDINKIEVKSFLTMAEKVEFVNAMVQGCIVVDENSIYDCDYVLKDAVYHILTAMFYAGLEVDLAKEEIGELYDHGCESGIFENVEKKIPKYELKNMSGIIDNAIRGKLNVLNSIKQILAEVFEGIPSGEELKAYVDEIANKIGDSK